LGYVTSSLYSVIQPRIFLPNHSVTAKSLTFTYQAFYFFHFCWHTQLAA